MDAQILVVSESDSAREALAAELRRRDLQPTLAGSLSEAKRVVREVAVDIVLLDGRQIDAKTKRARAQLERQRPGVRVVMLSHFGSIRNSTDLLQFGKGDYLISADELLRAALPRRDDETSASREGTDKAVRALVDVVDVLLGLLELGDPHFAGSSHRVQRLARAVAVELGVDVVDEVVIATMLRDIGKLGVDPGVLSHEGEYTSEDTDRMQAHVEGSARMLAHIDFPWKVLPVIRHHHERYDGNGYPDGLRGREIPIGSRIVAVVDAFVAMCSDRPHRPAIGVDEAIEELQLEAGRQFDPEVVEVLIRIVESTHGTRVDGRGTIVLYDPDEAGRRLLQMRLTNEGYGVEAVDSADATLDRLLREVPSLVIAATTDEQEDGYVLLREVRKDDAMAHVPFVLLAPEEDRILRMRALRSGVDDVLDRAGDLDEIVARVDNILAREAARRGERHGPRRRGVHGQLENLGLPDIVQTLSMGMKTARVALDHDGFKGRIWFRDGAIVHAKCGDEEGEAAFFTMVAWTNGEFVIEHGIKTQHTSIENDAMFLIMEGVRRLDEAGSA